MASKYARENSPFWYVRTKINGKWKSVPTEIPWKSKKREDKQRIEEILLQARQKEINEKKGMIVYKQKGIVQGLVEEFSKKEIPYLNDGTSKAIRSIRRETTICDNFCQWMKENRGIVLVDRIKKNDILDYLHRDIQDKQGNVKKMAQNTFRKELTVVKRFLQWCSEKHYLQENPAKDIRQPKAERKVEYFRPWELEILFQQSPPQFSTAYRMMYATGLRCGELSNLKWTDYNKDLKQLKIRVTEGNKKKEESIVYLNEQALKILKEQESKSLDCEWIFPSKNFTKINPNKIYDNLKLIQFNNPKMNKNCNVHSLRHTYGTELVSKGVPIFDVQRLMRHSEIKDTLIYAHHKEENLFAATNALPVVGQDEKQVDYDSTLEKIKKQYGEPTHKNAKETKWRNDEWELVLRRR